MSKQKDNVKRPSISVKLKEELLQKEKELHGLDDIFGMTLLTNPGYISSSRNIMFTNHLKQFVNLTNPDFPRVFTNYENMVGEHSTGYYKAKTDLRVIKKIPRFRGDESIGEDHMYMVFVYDEKKDRYDIIEKKNVEDLTEKFGYSYDNTVLNSKQEGNMIPKGEILYKSTSYDENGNYCYGKNGKFVYMLEPDTIEDAIEVSESFSKSMISKEIETVQVSLNDNDILCNIYGTNSEYQAFPNIGEYIKNKVICAKRRIHNNQLLYDVKKSNLKKINFTSDVLYYNTGRITDIIIYSNKQIEEIPDNSFNHQLLHYLKMQTQYYREVFETCSDIINSGSEYSNEIGFYYKKAKQILDENVKWREDDNSVFSNMVVEFVVERDLPLSKGQKITGRYGNKGVISRIRPDDEMPFLETGERVDIIFNSLGVINRLNSQQLFEQSITFITNRVKERMVTLSNMKEKEELLLKTIGFFNDKQEKELKKFIKSLPADEKKAFFESIEREGIYVHIPPLWEKEPLFDRLKQVYDEFDWIKPYEVFVNRFGRTIKVLKDLVVGDMYVIKLKQSSKKGFSARSGGSVSLKGVPEKSNKAKIHQELFSKTPIRIGDQENINSAIGVPTDIIAELHQFYRSSVIGRREFGEKLMTSIKELKDFKHSDRYTNRNVEILQAYLKTIGLTLNFENDMMEIRIPTGEIESFNDDNKLYFASHEDYEDIKREEAVRGRYQDDLVFFGTPEEFEDRIRTEVEILKEMEVLGFDKFTKKQFKKFNEKRNKAIDFKKNGLTIRIDTE